MNELGNNQDASAIVPVKRKRGRPRKYPRADPDHGVNIHTPMTQSVNHGENFRTPPGVGEVNQNQPHQVHPASNGNDTMVGQMVHGVIEAAFDAGYLLTVRVGNTESTLRGIVFKPGHYVPVSADNDVAPGVQMINRNEIPLPRGNYTQVHGLNPRSRDRNGTAYASQSSDLGALKGKQVVSDATQTATPGIPRGITVPVVVQSGNVSNGLPAASHPLDRTEASHPLPRKGEIDASHTSNGSTPANQVPHFQSQNNHSAIPSGAPSETGPSNNNPAEAFTAAEAKSMKLPGMLSKKVSGVPADDDASDTDQALSVEPLQAVQPDDHDHPAAMSRSPENFKRGKLNELFQILQENMENQETQTEEQAADSRPNPDELRSGPEQGGGDSGADKHV